MNGRLLWHKEATLLTHRKINCYTHTYVVITYRKNWPDDLINPQFTTQTHHTFPMHRSELIVRQPHASSFYGRWERAWSEQSIPPTGGGAAWQVTAGCKTCDCNERVLRVTSRTWTTENCSWRQGSICISFRWVLWAFKLCLVASLFGRFGRTCGPVFTVTEFRLGLSISSLILFYCLIKQPLALFVGVLKMHRLGKRYRSGITGFKINGNRDMP